MSLISQQYDSLMLGTDMRTPVQVLFIGQNKGQDWNPSIVNGGYWLAEIVEPMDVASNWNDPGL